MKISKAENIDRIIIYQMIDASYELAARKGKHPLENGCACITCINKRKRLLKNRYKKWHFKL